MTRNPQMVLALAVASIFVAFGGDRWAKVWAALTKDTSAGDNTAAGHMGTPNTTKWSRLDQDNDGWITVYRIGDDGTPESKDSGAERYIRASDLPADYYDGKDICKTGNILVVASEDISGETDTAKLRQLCVVREDVVTKAGMDKRKADDAKAQGGYEYGPAFARVPVFGNYQKFYVVPKVREHEGMMP